MHVINPEFNENRINDEAGEFTYKSLGVWRKIYLILNWLFFVAFVLVGVYVAVADESREMKVGVILFLILFLFCCTYWLHRATVQRNVSQLLAISILNIIPFLNPIAAVIVFSIRSASKSERGMRDKNEDGNKGLGSR